MAWCDFVVKYDPAKDTPEDLVNRIFYSIFVKRLKAHKPAVVFMGGDSGEGKSIGSLSMQEIVLKVQGLDINKYFDDINVYVPLEYPTKLDALLFSDRLKKVNILTMHEAREVVKAKNWQSFLSTGIADVNAMSRSIKPLMVIVVSQFIRDITNDIRYTLNYYVIIRRPKGKPARMYINVLWKDDRDLEKPKLRKRKLSGYLVYPNGRRKRYVPEYFELRKPNKELIDRFEKSDREAKSGIIRAKLDRLLSEMKEDIGQGNNKLDVMLKWYTKDLDALMTAGKRYRNRFMLKPEVREMHNLSEKETRKFEIMLNEEVKKKGLLKAEEKDITQDGED